MMIKLNEIYNRFQSILPDHIKSEIAYKNTNAEKTITYWNTGDYLVEYMNQKNFPEFTHISNGNPIFLQIFKITEEWSLLARFMRVKLLPTEENESDYFKISLENKNENIIIYILVNIKNSNETEASVMYCPGSPENPLELDYDYFKKLETYFNIKKVCVEDEDTRKELLNFFSLNYDIDLDKDKIFRSIDFIFLKTNNILLNS